MKMLRKTYYTESYSKKRQKEDNNKKNLKI